MYWQTRTGHTGSNGLIQLKEPSNHIVLELESRYLGTGYLYSQRKGQNPEISRYL